MDTGRAHDGYNVWTSDGTKNTGIPKRQTTKDRRNMTERREEATSTMTRGRRRANENDGRKRAALIGGGRRWGGAALIDRDQDNLPVGLHDGVRILQRCAVQLDHGQNELAV